MISQLLNICKEVDPEIEKKKVKAMLDAALNKL